MVMLVVAATVKRATASSIVAYLSTEGGRDPDT
jgi:hypothetical protein